MTKEFESHRRGFKKQEWLERVVDVVVAVVVELLNNSTMIAPPRACKGISIMKLQKTLQVHCLNFLETRQRLHIVSMTCVSRLVLVRDVWVVDSVDVDDRLVVVCVRLVTVREACGRPRVWRATHNHRQGAKTR